ncbi:MAG: YeaC family protein [bacterium]
MDYKKAIASLTPEIYQNMKRAVETGRWPDGRTVTTEQRTNALQAIIAYDQLHKPENERVGYIHTEKHQHCGSDGAEDDAQELVWKND